MKKLIYFISLAALILSCQKEEENKSSSATWLKVMDCGDDFFARDILELRDGSVLMGAVPELKLNFNESTNPSSLKASQLAKYSDKGQLEWQISLPETVHVLWHTLELNNGNIAILGFNSDDNSKQIGIVIINPEGRVLKEKSYYNVTNQAPWYSLNPVNFIELASGNIAIASSSSNITNAYLATRLVILDQDLNLLVDRSYIPNASASINYPGQISLAEDLNGEIILHGLHLRLNILSSSDSTHNSFSIRLSATTYNVISFDYFQLSPSASPSEVILNTNRDLIWASAIGNANDSLQNLWFNQRNQELYIVGSQIALTRIEKASGAGQQLYFGAYPKNAFITKVIQTSDGGYLLLGTCNINSNLQLNSQYQIMLIKLKTDFTLDWMRFPQTNSQSIARDVTETENGYFLSATHLSLGQRSRPLLLKTNKQGFIN
tara:strand:- start:605 stop:1909 length:1305 start_codon:yes stop_codon:yes gene_type:complete